MATPEERIDKLETRFTTLEQQFATTMSKVESLAEEAKQQREDIRQLNAKIDSKFDNLSNQIHNLKIAAVVGFSAIVVAAVGIVFTALK
ncbi:MAG: hypothetical protein IKT98_05380 [Selenomonadaceae bacterium]|nr:hypothetical protein [Selenomonadaceae bacterium]